MSKPSVFQSFWYYNSQGSGCIVYPKVLGTDGSVIWDGRKQKEWKSWKLEVGDSVTVDLGQDAGISDGQVVCAGFDVVWGSDRDDIGDEFTFANGSGVTAKFTFFGPVDNGTIQYDGWSTPEALKKRIETEQINHKGGKL